MVPFSLWRFRSFALFLCVAFLSFRFFPLLFIALSANCWLRCKFRITKPHKIHGKCAKNEADFWRNKVSDTYFHLTKKKKQMKYIRIKLPWKSYKEIATNSFDHKSTLKYASTHSIWIFIEKYRKRHLISTAFKPHRGKFYFMCSIKMSGKAFRQSN